MTSDKLDELPPERADLFAALLREPALSCAFPSMETQRQDGVIVQRSRRPDGSSVLNLFNTRHEPAERADGTLAPHASRLQTEPGDPLEPLTG